MTRKIVDDTGEFYFIAGWLDYHNFIEHGTSLRCAWLTDLGKELLDFLNTYLASERAE